MFSNRLLYFTTEATYFSCQGGHWTESYPFDESVLTDDYKAPFFFEDPKMGYSFNTDEPFDNYSYMVENLSRRKFTQEADVLNACRGFYSGTLLKSLGASVCGLPAACFELALAGNRMVIFAKDKHP